MTTADLRLETTEDVALVEAVQGGNVQAFEPLVERHLDHLHAFVSLKLPVPHLADEITHETFVFAFITSPPSRQAPAFALQPSSRAFAN